MTPFDIILHFLLEVTAISLHAKLDVFGLNHLRDIRGVTPVSLHAKLEVFAIHHLLDIRGSQNFKIGLHDPHVTFFDPILHFFSLELTAVRLRAKFEVSSFNHLRDIRGVTPVSLHAKLEVFAIHHLLDIRGSQNSKIGLHDPHVTLFDPILHFFP